MRATVKIEGLSKVMRSLKRLAPEIHKDLRVRFRDVAKEVAQTAKSNASWSKRIPGAIGVTVSNKGVGVRVSKKKAPHGPLYERGNKGSRSSSLRHPLFGNKAFWFSEPIRPFLRPAVEDHRDDATQKLLDAIVAARREVGLHG